jgi:hypothetical protein
MLLVEAKKGCVDDGGYKGKRRLREGGEDKEGY